MLCSCHGSLYAVIKETLKIRAGLDLGGVRAPFPSLIEEDMPTVRSAVTLIDEAISLL